MKGRMTNDDMALVREYAATQSEPAFAELVGRHFDFVYSAALRHVERKLGADNMKAIAGDARF